jgi:phosphoribosylformylglycinamidine cyclo-ligase
LPRDVLARIRKDAWPRPPVFQWLQQTGRVAEEEMFRVFNCGIGMVLIVAAGEARRAAATLRDAGETVYDIGAVEQATGEPQAVIV